MSREDHEETRRHLDVVAEGLRSDMRFLAEGLAMTNETLERFRAEFATFRADTGRSFADVHAELRTSRSEVDRRLKAVEGR
jgi:hypothetical protein